MIKSDNTISRRILTHLKSLSPVKKLNQSGMSVTRLAYSTNEKAAKDYFISQCKEENLEVRIDPAGNVIAKRPGIHREAPAVACGSHLDTVIDGGIYDGALGVFSALEVVRKMNRKNIQTEHPIEIMAFAAEESSRFGMSTIGSQAMTGLIDIDLLKSLKDHDGISFKEAIRGQNLNLDEFPLARREPNELKAFIELHVEQGPLLESQNCSIGIVSTIAAPTRYSLTVEGQSRHSGTTTMFLRKDALTAASEVVLAVERLAREETKYESVGTVGALNVFPGTPNTVPGRVELIVEFRSTSDASKKRLKQQFFETVKSIEQKRDIHIYTQQLSDDSPVPLDPSIQHVIQDICQEKNYPYLNMTSGAGHDAMNLAQICPTGLIFVPSVDGISHNPEEYTLEEDIETGFHVLYETILHLAKGDV